eukprot:CAMPEP_0194599914 /NCGR_PEP_ID=MMETSP0292-20121207/27969_1 /TAXON_ID=39354 /ORGANISM="Heterosigma akashiwo, Strain CCMP2393" /LENGTH=298 /DNA_ID=CAMNT_0039461319 /DNA_START=303 /DNA_END=1196 /DNA_ORIENTATION=+
MGCFFPLMHWSISSQLSAGEWGAGGLPPPPPTAPTAAAAAAAAAHGAAEQLLQRLPMGGAVLLVEAADHAAHVVHTSVVQGFLNQVLGRALHVAVLGQAAAHVVAGLLAGQHVPEAVAGQQQELRVGRHRHRRDLRLGDELLGNPEVVGWGEGLVINVPKGPGDGQYSIEPATMDIAPGLLDARGLVRARGLAVLAELLGQAARPAAQHRAAVAHVRHVHRRLVGIWRLHHQCKDCRRTREVGGCILKILLGTFLLEFLLLPAQLLPVGVEDLGVGQQAALLHGLGHAPAPAPGPAIG